MPDSKIDYSDIPPLSAEQLRSMTRLGRRAFKRGQVKGVGIF